MNRIRLRLAGEQLEDGSLSIAIARAAARNPRLKTRAVIALLRSAGAEAVNELVLENATFDVVLDAEPEHLTRLYNLKYGSPCNSSLSTSPSDCSLSSLGLDSNQSDGCSLGSCAKDVSAYDDDDDACNLNHLIRQNELRTAKFSCLMAERQRSSTARARPGSLTQRHQPLRCRLQIGSKIGR